MKKVLLTGARGFVGASCLEALLKRGFNVHAVSSKGRYNGYPEQVEWHHVDLHNAEQVLRLVATVQAEYLLHLAWDVTHGVYWQSLENVRWVKTSLNLVQAFMESGGRRVVQAGSCAEYDWRYGYCREDLTPLRPATLYGAAKDALRSICEAACREKGLSQAWGRLFFIYGPGEHQQRLIASLVSALLQGETVPCTHGEQVRDYLYLKDAAAALVALLDSDVEGPVNISAGRALILKDFIYEAAEQIGRPDLIQLGTLAVTKDDPPLLVGHNQRLQEEVGFRPRYSTATGLAETIAWWREQLQARN